MNCPECGGPMSYDDGLDDNGFQWHDEWYCPDCSGIEPYDQMDDIPWGTPDSWIPDNPDENGMRWSDFVELG